MKYLILLSNGEIREVYVRESDGRLMIVGVTSPFESHGFGNFTQIQEFYLRHFGLKIEEVVEV